MLHILDKYTVDVFEWIWHGAAPSAQHTVVTFNLGCIIPHSFGWYHNSKCQPKMIILLFVMPLSSICVDYLWAFFSHAKTGKERGTSGVNDIIRSTFYQWFSFSKFTIHFIAQRRRPHKQYPPQRNVTGVDELNANKVALRQINLSFIWPSSGNWCSPQRHRNSSWCVRQHSLRIPDLAFIFFAASIEFIIDKHFIHTITFHSIPDHLCIDAWRHLLEKLQIKTIQ